MLKTFREAQPWIIKVVLWCVVLAFVGTIFFAWGMGGETTRNTIAHVGGTAITLGEFQTAYQNLLNFYQQQYKERFTPELAQTLGLKRQVLNSLIQRHLLLQEAKREGLIVTDAELVEQIHEYPAFQVDGQFDKDRYRRLLQLNRLSPADFEQRQKTDLLIAKLQKLITESVRVAEAEVRAAYAEEYGKIKFQFLTVAPSLFESQISSTLNEEEIETYYQENKELFRKPEQIQVNYLVIDSGPITEQVVITDEAVANYYDEHKEAFKREQRVRARHILVKVAPDATPEEEQKAKARAEEALQRVKAGEDFATVAKEISEDPSSAERGGDLGFFGRGAMVKPFEEVAFALKPGEISDLVRSDFGYHIIQVEEVQEAGYQPLAEVKPVIVDRLKREKVEEQTREKAEALREEVIAHEGNMDVVMEREGVTLRTSSFFARTDRQIPDIANAPLFANTAFSLQEGEISEPLKLGQDYYLLKVVDRRESYIPELAEAKEEVRTKLLEAKTSKAAEEKAEALAKELQSGTSIQDVAKSMDLTVQETDYVTRRDPIPEIGQNPAFLDSLFQMASGETTVVPSEGKYYVVQVEGQQPFDEADFTEKRPALEQRLQANKEARVFQAWLDVLREQSKITINEELIALL